MRRQFELLVVAQIAGKAYMGLHYEKPTVPWPPVAVNQRAVQPHRRES